jgi:hypothetical protein
MLDLIIIGFAGLSLIVTIATRTDNNIISQEELTQIEITAQAAEIYLYDKHYHAKHCVDLKWNQPPLEIYEKQFKSRLPKKCKKDK